MIMANNKKEIIRQLYAENLVDIASLRGVDKTIIIMPDFGMGPWAWEKDAADESPYVGINIADASSGMLPERYPISDELKHDFANWVMFFESCCHFPTFHWDAFHRHGLELSRRLKAELGDRVKIVYTKPVEDPNYKTDEQTEIR
jgi:hypothetical protein